MSIYGEKDFLEPQIIFNHDEFKCKLYFEGKKVNYSPITQNGFIGGYKHFRDCEYLTITILDFKDKLKLLITSGELKEILKLIILIANRCIRSLRIYGWVTNLHEFNWSLTSNDLENILLYLNVEKSEDGKNWQRLIKEYSHSSYLSFLYSSKIIEANSELYMFKWEEIKESIQDNLCVKRKKESNEIEFVVNALENLRKDNIRTALIESIIGLEIILTKYIKKYFEVIKKYNKTDIDALLEPSFDLKRRILLIPELTFEEKELHRINLKNILTAIKWRNKIIHKIGDFPSGVKKKDKIEIISELINLILFLELKVMQITALPKILEIKKYIIDKYNILDFDVEKQRNHRIYTQFYNNQKEGLWKEEKINNINNDLFDQLKKIDIRFDPKEHFLALYTQLPNNVWATFSKGSFKYLKN
jgi:hypothetical protein